MSLSSSRSPSPSSDRTRVGLPETSMSFPGCRLSSSISIVSARFPFDQRRVVPLEGLLQGRRDDVFEGLVHVVRGRQVFATPGREEGGPLLVGHPLEQHGVRLGHRRRYLLPHLVVEVRELPLLRGPNDAVQGHQFRGYQLTHREISSFVLRVVIVRSEHTVMVLAQKRRFTPSFGERSFMRSS